MMCRVAMVLLLPMLVWAGTECKARCRLTNLSITVESDECGSYITINTTACAGLCQTQVQERAYRSPMAPYIQNTCNFKDWTYETIQLPGCAPGVDSSFTYPVALSCECSLCNTEVTDCGAFSMQPNSCHTHAYY
ncbi:follitropin subunit beta isoform X1 [Hemibagrus wyckioides]|uniref:follitropin subunit beta isoform X1 n=1 Tax=Hemibagrus wyckioides TaxID=337641 RepID=UPI00266DCB58|nr:follitropin subunit beta isoform X1 [Hemibagrus wyckioides]